MHQTRIDVAWNRSGGRRQDLPDIPVTAYWSVSRTSTTPRTLASNDVRVGQAQQVLPSYCTVLGARQPIPLGIGRLPLAHGTLCGTQIRCKTEGRQGFRHAVYESLHSFLFHLLLGLIYCLYFLLRGNSRICVCVV